jgi:two-component system, cell cycle sensor histidine kinase and response regulator CckA
MQIEHSEFQDQLVRGLAHRMNNILTLFHGYVGLLMDDKHLNKSTIEGLVKIQDGAKAATDLMDRANSLVRPPTIVWRDVKLGDFVRMLRPSFETLRSAKTKLVLDIPDDLLPIRADAARVKTAVFELVRNALEATFAHGGTVRLELRAETKPPGNHARQTIPWISFRVIDDGPGVPEELAERIYQPFYSTRKKRGAVGLGLPVVAGCVSQHGGVLRHTSEPGRTVFEMLLPCRAEAT